jgi:hypothetical protein
VPDLTKEPDDREAQSAESLPAASVDGPAIPPPPTPTQTRSSGCLAVVAYTVSRLVLLLVCWLPLQLFTPLRGLIALAVAVLASGIISYFLLDRRRDAMAAQLGSFFSRLNSRIDRSTKAEDDD